METQGASPSEVLLSEFQRRKTRNPAFSLRAFAKQIGIPAGRLSQYFSGKRAISEAAARRIAERMSLSPDQEKQFLALIYAERIRKGDSLKNIAGDSAFQEISADSFAVLSDWYYFAILNLLKIKGFRSDPAWIGERLGISTAKAKHAVCRLKRVGLLVEKRGHLVRVDKPLRTSDGLAFRALRISHEQSLQQAIHRLHEVSLAFRDITSMTMAVDLRRLPEAKKIIKDFRRKLSAFLECGEPTEVYNLNVQLVPVTKLKQDRGLYEH
jgi:uncharacterized protein (TIGR02147 family)